MSLFVGMCQLMSVDVSKCQYVSEVSHSVTQSPRSHLPKNLWSYHSVSKSLHECLLTEVFGHIDLIDVFFQFSKLDHSVSFCTNSFLYQSNNCEIKC